MTDASWTRLSDIVADALDLSPDTRPAFLDTACRDRTGALDADLYGEAAALVASAEQVDASGAFRSPVTRYARGVAAGIADSEGFGAHAPPETVGPWRVTSVLGEGGQGVVYRARRADGAFEREVALKLLRPGAAGPRLARRLAEERRVLGRLEHEGIARLYDGGVDDDGRPYLALELVDGEPLTEAARGLPVPARVRLLADVCDAVAYAHQRLVVHRDLKPSNILVTDDGAPKLLDFGVAKLLEAETDAELTVPGWMTPAYAAPEQVVGAASDEITTATDVYALGVLAYEVLAGQRPYDTEGLSPSETERLVAHAVPPPPSVASGARALRGDLDTVVMKALAKDPARRYASAEALAADLRRHLAGLPVEARPATVGYRVSRFVRRHRAGVLGTAAFLVAVVAVAGVAFARVTDARDRAETEAAKSDAVNTFILGMLGEADPAKSGVDVRVVDLLDRAAEDADSLLDGQPEVEGIVRTHLGWTYLNLSRSTESEREFTRAIRLFDSIDPDHVNGIDARNGLAIAYLERGDFEQADPLFRRALASAQSYGDAESGRVADLTANLANTLRGRGDLPGALAQLREGLRLEMREPEPDSGTIANAYGNIGTILSEMGRTDESLVLARRAMDLRRRMHAPGNIEIAYAEMKYAQTLRDLNRSREAVPVMESALEAFRLAASQSATEPYMLVHALVVYALMLLDVDRVADAEAALREARALATASFEPPDYAFARLEAADAATLLARERWAESSAAVERYVQITTETRGADYVGIGYTRKTQGEAWLGAGRPDRARTALQAARANLVSHLGESHADVADVDSLLALAAPRRAR